MKLFSTILLSALITMCFSEDTLHEPDTVYIGNTVKVEVQPSPNSTSEITAQERHADAIREATRTAFATEWMNRGTWTLAIFAFAAFLVSACTLRHARNQSRQELRAYVHVKLEDVFGVQELNAWMDGRMSNDSSSSMITGEDGPFWAHNPPRASYRISVANYGQTPAKRVTAQVNVVHDSWPHPQKESVKKTPTISQIKAIMDETRIANTLPPNQGDTFTLDGDLESDKWDTRMPRKFRWLIEEPGAAIYIYGYVGYTDVFDHLHVTYFRYAHITSRVDGRFRADGIPMHPEGNDAT